LRDFVESLEGEHRLALAFGCYACGIILAAHDPSTLQIWLVAVAVAATIALTRRSDVRPVRTLSRLAPIAFSFGLAFGASAISRSEHPAFAALDGHHVVLEGVALERPKQADGLSMRVRVVHVRAPAAAAAASLAGQTALVTFPSAPHLPSFTGTRVLLRARLFVPGGARNEGEPSERDSLGEQGVAFLLSAHRSRDVSVLGPARGWDAWWSSARQALADRLEAQLPPLEATVLEGILWGDRGNLPASLRQEFSDTGTVHVLTTAGLHLGIMAGFLTALLMLTPLRRPLRAVVVLIFAWAYAALAGMHLPTVRAAGMLTAGTIAVEAGRTRTPSAVLAVAACAVALPHPLAVLSPSFSMSFACVAGIALLNPMLTKLGLRDDCGLPPLLAEVLRTSLSVQIALWPLQALYFYALTPYAVLANAVVVPLVGLIMAVGALLCVASVALPPLALPLGNIAWWGLAFLIGAVERFGQLPYAHMDVPPPSHAFLVLYWTGLIAAARWVHVHCASRPPRVTEMPRIAAYAAAAGVFLAFVYAAPAIRNAFDRNLYVHAIDVGQADCILLRAPGGHAMLIDGGGRLERTAAGSVIAAPIGDRIATRVVVPFLLRHWVLKLDAVVLTHPHGDHAGGLPVILEHERVGVLYDSGQPYGGPAYRRTLHVLEARAVPWSQAVRGVRGELGPAHFEFLAPERPFITGSPSDVNNNSAVVRVTYGQVAMLFTGDAQAEAEARMLSHGGTDLRADILKVGHHGSAYSSTPEFLAAVHPKIAIISCGLHNVFGHPSTRTLTALRGEGSQIYRTDLDGGVSIITDGASLQTRAMHEKLSGS